jgi:uncharacterized Fe-S cluster-containing radical SAM superfamily protein
MMRPNRLINTAVFAAALRSKIIRPRTREVLVSRISGSDQEHDLTLPVNCGGLGRIHHFRRRISLGWPQNPLPIDPAAKALGLHPADVMTAQVFQNAACAWRCWYCYVPFSLLAGNPSRGEWVTAQQLVALYSNQAQLPRIIDLSGGSPDLTPEWVVWMMEAIDDAGLAESTYLWSDDNLSTSYVFTELNHAARRRLASRRNYGRVCCFKGFDTESFIFNTQSEGAGYEYQFELFRRYLALGIDLFGYVTLTGPTLAAVPTGVKDLVGRLRAIHEALPLRVVPLKIQPFTPTRAREVHGSTSRLEGATAVQEAAVEVWNRELDRHYSTTERTLNIADVPLRDCR